MTCDGEPLTLPDDIEGVLFLNINSYMGGVDLWASGYSSAGSARTGKQSYCDGMLEVWLRCIFVHLTICCALVCNVNASKTSLDGWAR